MKFLRLPDPLLSVLYQDEEIIALDKPYGLNSHTNESKQGQADFVQHGLIEIFEKQLSRPLNVVHRLDQTTTGVIVFAKTTEAAKKYADYFFERKVEKCYYFVTANSSTKDHFFIDKKIIHKGKDLDAETEFKLVDKNSGFELWQAFPHTGRNHQIRIHAQAAGISIVGDEKYGGKPYLFLCLHNQQIKFPDGLTVSSNLPRYFSDLKLLSDLSLTKTLFSVDRRQRLFSISNKLDQCCRLVHNKNEDKDLGFTLDQMGKNLILSVYQESWGNDHQKIFSYISDFLQKPILVRLMHNRGKDPLNKSQFLIAANKDISTAPPQAEESWIAKENTACYEMRSNSGQSFGLFLDQRLQREWVNKNSSGKSVLNLFAYTCGFSVVAALGLAAQVTSVDTSKTVLNWGKKNFELNHLDTNKHKFYLRDSIEYLDYCFKKNIRYDLIICDPPSFSRGESGVFKIETALEDLLKKSLQCLTGKGTLLFSTNFEKFYIDDIRKSILNVQKNLKIKDLEISSIQSALDFELVGQAPILKSFLIRLTDI
ncbi:MAG: class I SAM-dependent methyltransferase [Pseudobdellovibrionaceae bacterium]